MVKRWSKSQQRHTLKYGGVYVRWIDYDELFDSMVCFEYLYFFLEKYKSLKVNSICTMIVIYSGHKYLLSPF